MKNFIVYNSKGKILRIGTCQDNDVNLQAQENEYVIEGVADIETQYVNANAVYTLPTKPGVDYIFNYDSFVWELDLDKVVRVARAKRQKLLVESDWTQLSDAPVYNRPDWIDYRQKLRDITDQEGWPTSIIWPQTPA